MGGQAALVGQRHAGLGGQLLGWHRQQVPQVVRDLHAGLVPALVDQVAVGVVTRAEVEAQVGVDARQHLVHLGGGDAALVGLLAQVGVLRQGLFFHRLGRGGEQVGLAELAVAVELDLHHHRRVDQAGQVVAGGHQFLFDRFEQAHVLGQLTLVAQRVERGAQLFFFGPAGVDHRLVGQRERGAHLAVQALGAGGAPVGHAHVLHQQVGGLAAALGGGQHAVASLLAVVLGQAEVEQAPGHVQLHQRVLALLRDRRIDADLLAGGGVDAARQPVAVTRRIAGRGHQLGQAVVGAGVVLLQRHGLLHQAGAAVEVVFQGPGDRLVEAELGAQRRHVAARRFAVGTGLGLVFIGLERLRRQLGAGGEQGQRRRGDQGEQAMRGSARQGSLRVRPLRARGRGSVPGCRYSTAVSGAAKEPSHRMQWPDRRLRGNVWLTPRPRAPCRLAPVLRAASNPAARAIG